MHIGLDFEILGRHWRTDLHALRDTIFSEALCRSEASIK